MCNHHVFDMSCCDVYYITEKNLIREWLRAHIKKTIETIFKIILCLYIKCLYVRCVLGVVVGNRNARLAFYEGEIPNI